jgi:hypothetical protein
MSDFRTKLLGLAGVAMVFASAAFGQQATCTASAPAPTGIRAEGQTDLTGDVVLFCQTLTATAVARSINPGELAYPNPAQPPAAVFLLTNLPASSIFLGTSGGINYTEALAIVSNASAPLPAVPAGIYASPGTVNPAYAQGYITSSGLDFINIPTPALPAVAGSYYTITFTNIRVNAASNPAVGIATVQPYITGSPILNQNFISPTNVGTVTSGLNPVTLTTTAGVLLPATGILEFICQAVAATIDVNVSERFQTAFKTRGSIATNGVYQPEAFQTVNTETGYVPPTGFPTIGTQNNVASAATRIKLVFNNVPPGLSVYTQNIVTSTTDPLNGIIQLTASETGGFTPIAVTVPVLGVPPVGFTLIGTGSSTVTTFQAVYEITAQSPIQFEAFPIPVYMGAPANTLNPSGPMTITTSFAPIVAIPTPGVVETFANYPSFVNLNSPQNAEYQTFCLTTLLFPYVTNYQGTYETGMAIANTTTDNLGAVTTTAPNGKSVSVPTNGTCTINFYSGTGTQPAPFVTPVIGVNTTAAPTAGAVYANTLTVMSGATNFTGYAIALCQFLEGHGFAFITDYGNTTEGYAQGYVAVVLPNGRFEQLDGTVGHLTAE